MENKKKSQNRRINTFFSLNNRPKDQVSLFWMLIDIGGKS